MPPVKDNPLYQSRKLPTEVQLRESMEVLPFTDPYDSKLFPVMGSAVSDFKKDQKERKKSGYYYGTYQPDMSNVWIAAAFRDDFLTPETVPSDSDHAMPDILTGVDAVVADYATQSSRDVGGGYRHRTIKSGNDLTWVSSDWHHFIGAARNEQQRMTFFQLKEKGYVQLRDDVQIREEIHRTQEQYPGSQVWVVCGGELIDYYMGVHKHDIELEGATLIQRPSGCRNHVEGWESAIFSERQIRASHRFVHSFAYERVPRAWELYYINLMFFSVEISDLDKASKEPPIINATNGRTKQSSFRFRFDE